MKRRLKTLRCGRQSGQSLVEYALILVLVAVVVVTVLAGVGRQIIVADGDGPGRGHQLAASRAGTAASASGLAALVAARDEPGRWPTAAEWDRAGGGRRLGRS